MNCRQCQKTNNIHKCDRITPMCSPCLKRGMTTCEYKEKRGGPWTSGQKLVQNMPGSIMDSSRGAGMTQQRPASRIGQQPLEAARNKGKRAASGSPSPRRSMIPGPIAGSPHANRRSHSPQIPGSPASALAQQASRGPPQVASPYASQLPVPVASHSRRQRIGINADDAYTGSVLDDHNRAMFRPRTPQNPLSQSQRQSSPKVGFGTTQGYGSGAGDFGGTQGYGGVASYGYGGAPAGGGSYDNTQRIAPAQLQPSQQKRVPSSNTGIMESGLRSASPARSLDLPARSRTNSTSAQQQHQQQQRKPSLVQTFQSRPLLPDEEYYTTISRRSML